MIIDEYLKFTSCNSAPKSFHTWSILSMISAAVGKKLWVKCNYFNAYPNMYMVLVSLPGVGKKSTSISLAYETLKQAELETKFSFDSLTPQALMIALHDAYGVEDMGGGKLHSSSPLTVIADELVSLLSSGPSMVEFLTNVFSVNKYEYKTKNMGECIIKNPCLNIATCATTDTFSARIIREGIAGGFMSRAIIVYDDNVKPVSPFCMPSEEQEISRLRMVERFREMSKLYGEVTWTPKAVQHFEQWFGEEMVVGAAKAVNKEFSSRKDLHVIKTSMLVAASELRRVINEDDFNYAVHLLKQVEHNMKFLYIGAGANKFADLYIKILAAIHEVGDCEYSQLLQYFMKDIEQSDFDNQIKTLETVGYIKRFIADKKETIMITNKGKEMFSRYV